MTYTPFENLMDFARGRLGGGIAFNQNGLTRTSFKPCDTGTETDYPEAKIAHNFPVTYQVSADRNRIAQLFSNLSNALNHGEKIKKCCEY